MITSLVYGIDFFKRKMILPVFLFTIMWIISYFTYDYLINIVATFDFMVLESLAITGLLSLMLYIIEFLGYRTILFIVMFFLIFFINNYIVYLICSAISHTNNSKNLKIVFNYSLVAFLIFVGFGLLYVLLLFKITAITIILMILLTILLIVTAYIFYLTIFIMASEEDLVLYDGLTKAWYFLKRKFWLFTFFLIFLFIILEILNIGVLLLIIPFLETANLSWILEDIIFYAYYLFVMLYASSCVSYFVTRHKTQ